MPLTCECRSLHRPSLPVLLALLALLFTKPLNAQNAPAEAPGFSGEGLHLYPLGWSGKGHWGTLVGRDTSSLTQSVSLVIVDAVTDSLVYQSPAENMTIPLDSSWPEFGPALSRQVAIHNLDTGQAQNIRSAEFITLGQRFHVHLVPPVPGKRTYTVHLDSSGSGSKQVYSSDSSGDTVPFSKAEVLGLFISPFEPRSLIVVRETPQYGQGPVNYRFIGAHLTQGFSPAETATARTGTSESLLLAVLNGQEYLVRSRLDAGADPNQSDVRGYPALLVAARLGHWTMVADLLKAGARPDARDSDGRTALHHAALRANVFAIRTLVDAGADTTITDNSGKRAEDLAPIPDPGDLFQ